MTFRNLLYIRIGAAPVAGGRVEAAIVWGLANKIREIRNDVIHACWWDYSDVGITRGRVHRDGKNEVILMTPEQLDSDCNKLQTYAETLDSAMDGIWLNIYLPRLNDETAD